MWSRLHRSCACAQSEFGSGMGLQRLDEDMARRTRQCHRAPRYCNAAEPTRPLYTSETGRYDEACMWAEQAVQGDPNYVPGQHIAAASNALAGRIEKAQQISARLRQLDPRFRVSRQKDYFPF